MKILYLGKNNSGEVFRGPEKVARRISDCVSALGNDCIFAEYFFDGSRFSLRDKLFGRTSIRKTAALQVDRLGIFPLLRLLLSKEYDLIHIITFERFAIVALLLKWLIRKPVAFSVHGIVRHEHLLFRPQTPATLAVKDFATEYLFFKYADIIFFLSEHSVRTASAYYTIPARKIAITANGADDIFIPVKKPARRIGDPVSIVFIGDPSRKEKGFDFFMRGIERCSGNFEVSVVIESLSAHTGAIPDARFRFIPKMPTAEYAGFLARQDIYVSTSSYESFSIAAAEAMSSGMVPVVTKETGMSRFITHRSNGMIVNFGDEDSLAAAISELVKDTKLRESMSREAEKIRELLSWERIAHSYEDVYKERVKRVSVR